jgi:hypothetical protein
VRGASRACACARWRAAAVRGRAPGPQPLRDDVPFGWGAQFRVRGTCGSTDEPKAAPARPRQHAFGITQLPPQFLFIQRHRDTLGVIDRSALIGGDREARHTRKRTHTRRRYAGRASLSDEQTAHRPAVVANRTSNRCSCALTPAGSPPRSAGQWNLTNSDLSEGPGTRSGLRRPRNGLKRDGSDGTRTRDLRRDSSVPSGLCRSGLVSIAWSVDRHISGCRR